MKEYKRRRRNDDFLQVLGSDQTDYEFVLNPGSEEARRNQEQSAEQQSTMQRTSLPEHRDDDSVVPPHRDDDERVDHGTFVLWLVAAVLLVAVIAVAIIFKQ